jgi:hypothetical protein
MERYLGADVHARSTTLEVLGPSGKRVRRDVVETNGHALVTYLKQLTGNLHLCIEEGEWSQWLVEILSPHLAEIVVFPGEWKPGSRNDAIDAHDLANRIRTRRLPRTVYKDPRRFTDLREYSRAYTMVTRDVARTKCRIKILFRGRGIPVSGDSVYSEAGRTKGAQLLPVATRQAMELLGRELDHLRSNFLSTHASTQIVSSSEDRCLALPAGRPVCIWSDFASLVRQLTRPTDASTNFSARRDV